MSKTAYKRASRVAGQIRMEVAEILLRKTKDPRLHSVTVTFVELTDDLRLARVYVTTGQQVDEERVFAGLTKASGFIRGELGRRLSLRYNPEVIFCKDTSGSRGDHILALLDSLDVPTEADGCGGGDGASESGAVT